MKSCNKNLEAMMKAFQGIIFTMLFLITQIGFSTSFSPMRGVENRNRWRSSRMRMMESRGDMGFLVRIFGLEPLTEKYRIQIEKVYLESREKKLSLLRKRRESYEKLEKLLNKKYETVQRDYLFLIKELYRIQKEISAINSQSMDKIRRIHERQEKEMYLVLDQKMRELEADTNQQRSFFEEMKLYRR